MEVSKTMDLGQLAERMGEVAERADAQRLRTLLIDSGYDGQDTANIPEDAWLRLLNAAFN